MLAWVLADARQQNMTVIWVTHNLEDLTGLPARYCRLENGKLREAGAKP
jgi:ABC-type thiamine transport system ATPase subunit